MPHRYDTDYEIAQDHIRTCGMDFHNPVFVISALLVPTLVTAVWMTAFGGSGLERIKADVPDALQAAAITVGLPYTLVLLAMCIALYPGLKHEQRFVPGGKEARADETRKA